MNWKNLLLASVFSLACLTAFTSSPADSAQTDPNCYNQPHPQCYFAETGHTVRDPFIDFFVKKGGVAIFGYPITDDYVDPKTGLLVQYFQNARMEWHPSNPDPYKVQLGLLGDELGWRQPPLLVRQIPFRSDPNCRYFPETGHTACLKFLEFWGKNGGVDIFGYPIAEYTIDDRGRIIQYFQRAKMEWHPEKPEGQRVQLAPVGKIYYEYFREDPSRLKPKPPTGQGASLYIRVRSSVMTAITRKGSMQTGYVYVTNQLGMPVEGAAVTLVVRQPTGNQVFTLPPTNKKGTTYQSFPVGAVKPGTIVSMEFIVTVPGMAEVRSRTSYMVWFY